MTSTLTTYEIRVDGHLDDHWSAWLGDVALTRNDDGTTTVTAPVAEQAQLHGVLARLGDIGAVLTELRSAKWPNSALPSVLDCALHTERLCLRAATNDDTESTWTYRRLPSVNEWLTGCPPDIDSYGAVFTELARLATTVIVAPATKASALAARTATGRRRPA